MKAGARLANPPRRLWWSLPIERTDGGLLAHAKGAPEVILARCSRILD